MDQSSNESILLLSTADWDAPLWTNKQYMACELALSYDVTYVESLGLRRPQLTRRDARRALSRLLSRDDPLARGLPRKRPEKLRIVAPRVIPYHSKLTYGLNRRLVHRIAGEWIAGPSNSKLLWSYSPITYGLEDYGPVVYHCVDLLGAYPGIDMDAIRRGETRLAEVGATAVASSPEVRVHLEALGFRRVIEWLNVAETEAFLVEPATEREPNLVVFGGNISPYKFDCSYVAALKDQCPAADIVLAGPIAEGGGREWSDLSKLRDLGVRFTGRLSIHELAALFNRASVGIIPYLLNDYTRGVLPLKVNEYLASGLPVVASPLPSLGSGDQDVIVASSPDIFAQEVISRLGRIDPLSVKRRRDRAASGSWTGRGRQARALVQELVAGGGRG